MDKRKKEPNSLADGANSEDIYTVISQFYRGEMQRTYNWRQRLDKTINWAIVTIAGLITFVFSNPTHLHFVLLIGFFAVFFFAAIESRRYRTYVIWNSRIRVIEENFLAPLLSSEEEVHERDWKAILAADLKSPVHKIGFLEAFARRVRRIYIWLFLILGISWFGKLTIHPTQAKTWSDILVRASVGDIPGFIVVGIVLTFLLAITLVTLFRWGSPYGILQREAKGRIRPKEEKERNWRNV